MLYHSYDTNTVVMTSTHCNLEHANNVVSKNLLVSDGDLKGSKALGPRVWPVLQALQLTTLKHIGYHDNGGDFLLPHQAPEVNQGCGNGTWRSVVRVSVDTLICGRLQCVCLVLLILSLLFYITTNPGQQ